MNIKLTLAAVAMLGLAACDMPTMSAAPSADPLADNAMAVVRSKLTGTELSGGVTITPAIANALAECVAGGATEQELTLIAANADDTITRTTISTVLARPETVSCATSSLT